MARASGAPAPPWRGEGTTVEGTAGLKWILVMRITETLELRAPGLGNALAQKNLGYPIIGLSLVIKTPLH
jgi:hypothetical protein